VPENVIVWTERRY